MRKLTISTLLFFVLAVFFAPATVSAQDDLSDDEFQELCSALVDAAYAQLQAGCADVPAGQACYGFLGSTAYLEADGSISQQFQDPADQQELTDLEALRTDIFQFFDEIWGITLYNTYANLPVGLPGDQRMTILMFGDVRLETDTEPENVYTPPASPLFVLASDAGTSVFNNPPGFDEASQPVGTTGAAEELTADAHFVDANGALWLRVYFEYEALLGLRTEGWVRADELLVPVTQEEAEANLPFFGPETYAAYQDIYLVNGFTQPDCEAVPDNIILLQGPDGVETDLFINEAPITFTSVSQLQVIDGQGSIEVDGESIPLGSTMEILVLSGFAQVRPGGGIVPAGHKAFICLEGPFNLGVDDQENDQRVTDACPWSEPVRATLEEIERARRTLPGGERIVTVVIVLASGIGGVVEELRFERVLDLVRFQELCDAGLLPVVVCEDGTQ